MKIIFTVFCLMGFMYTNAQFLKENKIYIFSDFNNGNYFGYTFGVNYIHKKNYSLVLSYSGAIRQPYNEEISAPILFVFDFTKGAWDYYNTGELLAGKIYNFNKKGTIRLNLLAGVGYTQMREVAEVCEDGSYRRNEYYRTSFILNPKIEFPFLKYCGMYISPKLSINSRRRNIGLGIGLMHGVLR